MLGWWVGKCSTCGAGEVFFGEHDDEDKDEDGTGMIMMSAPAGEEIVKTRS